MGVKKSYRSDDPLDLEEKIVIIEPPNIIHDCRRIYRKIGMLNQELFRMELGRLPTDDIDNQLTAKIESQLGDMSKRQIASLFLTF